jgi:hypothetical protein
VAGFLLIHPPLLGPTVWQRCATDLRERGHQVAVPDLRALVEPAADWWTRWAAGCGRYAGTVDVVAGHSGSGVVLPAIAEAVDADSVLFVDAIVPSAGPASAPSDQLIAFVRNLPSGDHLPPWSTWWPEDVLADALPEPELRTRIAAEQPMLPVDFYEHAVPVPPRWTHGRSISYLRFSEAYEQDADEAAQRGWPVRYLAGSHLHLLDHAAEVAAVLASLIEPDNQCR